LLKKLGEMIPVPAEAVKNINIVTASRMREL
jgi:hypothetical protein